MGVRQSFKIFVYRPYMNPKYLDQKGITYHGAYKSSIVDYDICFSTRTDDWKKAMVDLKERKGNKLEGVVYEIDSEALTIFDDSEKLLEGEHERIQVTAETQKGELEHVYTYICPHKEGYFRPSKEYIDLIVEGALINKLSESHIDHIRGFLM
jgi:cation transport regulator ChaC